MGCNGGWLPVAWQYLTDHGIPSNSCLPYTSGNGNTGSCPGKCADGSAPTFYKAKNPQSYPSASEMKMAIMEGGPIESAFTVYQDFMNYKSGVYIQHSDVEMGGHAIKVVGWGVDNGVDYFIVYNSWGTDWGMNGLFWIGTNQCGIDQNGYAGEAA
jgi:cathepsin B